MQSLLSEKGNYECLTEILTFLPPEVCQSMQILSRSFYHEIMPRACEKLDTPVRFVEEDLADKPMFVQYYEGCLLVVDIASAMDLQRRLNKKKVPRLEWQAIIPNPFGSD